MDIINFFNIIILTQIMLTQQSDKKNNILNQTLELSINWKFNINKNKDFYLIIYNVFHLYK